MGAGANIRRSRIAILLEVLAAASGTDGSLQTNGGIASTEINFGVGFRGRISWREII